MHLHSRYHTSFVANGAVVLLLMLLLCAHRSLSKQQHRALLTLTSRVFEFITKSYRESPRSNREAPGSGFGKHILLDPHVIRHSHQSASFGTFEIAYDPPSLKNTKENVHYIRNDAKSVDVHTGLQDPRLVEPISEGELNDTPNSSSSSTTSRLYTSPSVPGKQTNIMIILLFMILNQRERERIKP